MLLSERNRVLKQAKIKKSIAHKNNNNNKKSTDINNVDGRIEVPKWIPKVARPYVVKKYSSVLGQIFIWKNSTVDIYGYKGFDKDMKCREMQYKLNKLEEYQNKIGLCCQGLHFCLDAIHVGDHYKLDIQSNNILCEIIIPKGSEIQFSIDKCVTNKLIPVKAFTGSDIFKIVDGVHIGDNFITYIKESVQHRTEGPAIIFYQEDSKNKKNKNVRWCRWMTKDVYTREQDNRPLQMLISPTNNDIYFFSWKNNRMLAIDKIFFPNEVKMLKQLIWSNKIVDFNEEYVSYDSLVKLGIGVKTQIF